MTHFFAMTRLQNHVRRMAALSVRPLRAMSRTGEGKDQVIPRFHRFMCVTIPVVLFAIACAHQAPVPASRESSDPINHAIVRGDWEAARRHYEQILAEKPDDCQALYHIGYIWGQLSNRIGEIESYEQAVACGYTSDDRLFFNLGMAYADQGYLKRAAIAFERAVVLRPDNADNQFGLGLVEEGLGHTDKAERALRQAIALDAGHWEARLSLTRLLLDQSRWEEARKQLDAVAEGDPGNQEARNLRQMLISRKALEYER